MSQEFTLTATVRQDVGKGASRRQRRLTGEVPAIIYGGSAKPEMIGIAHNKLAKALENEAFYSHIITLDVAGKTQDVILKDLQRHPAREDILHADFMRVSKTKKLTTRVPLHFINEETSMGVKTQGGIIAHLVTEIEIQCLPKDLPEYIEVDMAAVEVGENLHLSDLKLPKGVESTALSHGEEHDLSVAAINKPKSAEEAAEAEAEPEAKAEDDSEGEDKAGEE